MVVALGMQGAVHRQVRAVLKQRDPHRPSLSLYDGGADQQVRLRIKVLARVEGQDVGCVRATPELLVKRLALSLIDNANRHLC